MAEENAGRRYAIALVGVTLAALMVRLLIAPPSGGLVDGDADLPLRRALAALAQGPGVLSAVDPMIAWPDGARVDWPVGFDLLLASIAAVSRDFERAAALAIPVLGALAIP